MKTIFTLSLITIMAFLSLQAVCQKQKREISSFDEIHMGIAGDLYITQSSTTSLELEGDNDDLEEIITEVSNGKLTIKYKNNKGWKLGRDRITIHLSTPEISVISLGGSGKIMSQGLIESNDLTLSVSGSGKITLEVNADELDQKISGSGNMYLSGEADRANISISGSGQLDAVDMEVDHYTVRISGSGKCKINVGDSLEANISGSGSVYYKGDPDKIRSNVSGSGKVRPL